MYCIVLGAQYSKNLYLKINTIQCICLYNTCIAFFELLLELWYMLNIDKLFRLIILVDDSNFWTLLWVAVWIKLMIPVWMNSIHQFKPWLLGKTFSHLTLLIFLVKVGNKVYK
jgi:hypothetical protein